jgi:hypothetical protein
MSNVLWAIALVTVGLVLLWALLQRINLGRD